MRDWAGVESVHSDPGGSPLAEWWLGYPEDPWWMLVDGQPVLLPVRRDSEGEPGLALALASFPFGGHSPAAAGWGMGVVHPGTCRCTWAEAGFVVAYGIDSFAWSRHSAHAQPGPLSVCWRPRHVVAAQHLGRACWQSST